MGSPSPTSGTGNPVRRDDQVQERTVPEVRAAVKRVFLGRARSSRELGHQLLPRWMALPVFSSDPLSSVAYATQEMMLVLALAGVGAFALVGPLSAGVAMLLVIVVASYRQTVRAYPHGGGAYSVARENLGETPGLVAAGALLIDYILTVAVSIAAGTAAIVSAFPDIADLRLVIALGLVTLVMLANLRGVREASLLFALPTYLFVVVMLGLIAVGLVRCAAEGCPPAPTGGVAVEPVQALTLFIVLRAFATGAAALAGVEAISNGVTAFRRPQSHNAASTLAIMGVLAVSLFAGISFLAVETGAVPIEGGLTVVAQIALAVLGDGVLFYLVQGVTAAILVLAANTAYADFPRLGSVLARDRWLPRQLIARGDRLVFSNGVVILSLATMLLLVVYRANVTELVQLYVVGVFTSFTLSQAGMVRHWRRTREPGWQRSVALNGVGAVATGVVLVISVVTKFTAGAWIVVLAIPTLVALMRWVNRHYRAVSVALRAQVTEPAPIRPHDSVLLIDRVDEAAARALSYVLATSSRSVHVKAVPIAGEDVEGRWHRMAPDIPLEVLVPASSRGVVGAIIRSLRAHTQPDDDVAFTNVVIAETLSRSWSEQIAEHRLALRVKRRLLAEGGFVVTDVTSPIGGPGPYTVEEPVDHHVVILVAAANSATMRAIAYAQGLQPTSIRALSVNLDSEGSSRILDEWEDWGVEVPLELVDSPYRSLTSSVRSYVRAFTPDGRYTVVTCVLPEFVLSHWYHQPLHNQTALAVKAALLFERGVVTTSVPYHLGPLLNTQRQPADADADADTRSG